MIDATAAGKALDALPILYSFRRCPYAMRARLAIAASRQRCELREVVLRDKPAGLIAASSKATVPVLVLPDGQVLDQSLDIMHWALGRNDPEVWLPQGQADREATEALVAQNDGDFKQHLDRYKYPNRYMKSAAGPAVADDTPVRADAADVQAFVVVHRTAASVFVSALETRLQGEGQGLVGNRWSIADAAILPFVRQFAATDPAWFDAQAWPAVQAWLAAFIASSRYGVVMEKYARWQDESPVVTFPG